MVCHIVQIDCKRVLKMVLRSWMLLDGTHSILFIYLFILFLFIF